MLQVGATGINQPTNQPTNQPNNQYPIIRGYIIDGIKQK
jgi:hypothetical protein